MSPEQTIESHCSDNYKKLKNMTSDLWPNRRKSKPWNFFGLNREKNATKINLRDDHYHIYKNPGNRATIYPTPLFCISLMISKCFCPTEHIY